jgi:hypothetical protein
VCRLLPRRSARVAASAAAPRRPTAVADGAGARDGRCRPPGADHHMPVRSAACASCPTAGAAAAPAAGSSRRPQPQPLKSTRCAAPSSPSLCRAPLPPALRGGVTGDGSHAPRQGQA